jgi:predicted Zn-dependent peptidase
MNVLEETMDTIYYRGSSYAYPVDDIEYHPTPTYLSYENILKWYKWFYHPSNMVCSIVSNLSFSRVVNILKQTKFMESSPTQKPLSIALPSPILTLLPMNDHPEHARIEYISKKGMAAAILSIGFRTCSYHSHDKYILMVLQQILNGYTGKLFMSLREKRGLTYTSSCTTEYEENTGNFMIRVVTDPNKLIKDHSTHDGVLPVLIQLIVHLQRNGVTNEDLRIAKGNIKGSFLLELQSNNTIATYNGIQTILGSPAPIIPYQQIYDTYLNKITKAQIHQMIKKYICKENMVVGLLCDHTVSKKKIEEIINHVE